MVNKTGLRTEIVISTVLLLGAALLFAGLLLIKLAEQELLEERRLALQRTARLVAATEPAPAALPELLLPLTRDGELVAWQLFSAEQVLLAAFSSEAALQPAVMPPVPLDVGEIGERLAYSSTWNPFTTDSESYLDLVVHSGAKPGGILHLRFSLESLVAKVHRAQRLMLVYVVLYGLVLSLFGIFVLNRNVVEPVRRLSIATAGIASGDLSPLDVPAGPGEIRELAQDFNKMVAALQTSRAETAAQIHSLEEANRALQQARNEVVRAEKLASVGHLAAGMAHEIGNPLAAVIGYLNLMKTDLRDPAQNDLVERSLQETGRIDRLVRELLDFAAPASGVSERFDPLAALRDAADLLTNQGVLEGVALVDRASLAPVRVDMDRSRFVQVCVNLLLNARDAMPAGGQVTIDASRCGADVVLTLADTGTGIPGEMLPRIFEPFFTTKDPGKGRGLGLAVCQRLIGEAGGQLAVQSEPGQGSCFTLRLPAVQEVV